MGDLEPRGFWAPQASELGSAPGDLEAIGRVPSYGEFYCSPGFSKTSSPFCDQFLCFAQQFCGVGGQGRTC